MEIIILEIVYATFAYRGLALEALEFYLLYFSSRLSELLVLNHTVHAHVQIYSTALGISWKGNV